MTQPPLETFGPAIVPLLREIGDLKRVTAAHLSTSFAADRFLRAWGDLTAGVPIGRIAPAMAAEAVVAARLGAIDAARLALLGLGDEESRTVREEALDGIGAALPAGVRLALKAALPDGANEASVAPAFAEALARQPRAGVTCPGRARIMLQPEENHADHSYAVAVYAYLLAPAFGADADHALWLGLVHHLHSAAMPDAGFTGEMLLEPHLARIIERARELALAQLEAPLRQRAEGAFKELAGEETPEARAFHAADVIDRVLEIAFHLGSNRVTMGMVLNEYELVHDGPVKAFHDDVLAAVGLP